MDVAIEPLGLGHDDRLKRTLDYCHEGLHSSQQSVVTEAIDLLTENLLQLRNSVDADTWLKLIVEGRRHPIADLLHQDPFTFRSFSKPDGYAGDARLLDFIYVTGDYAEAVRTTSDIGRRVFARNYRVPSCRAVRRRRDIIAEEIGDTLRSCDKPRILSIACGNLREAERVAWPTAPHLDLFAALDADARSIEEVAQQNYHPAIRAIQANASTILRGRLPYSDFDLIYALGLYDYLEERFAARLTEACFGMLRSGGKLIVGNFASDAVDAGYMEMYMDWFLKLRDEPEMLRLAQGIDEREIADLDVSREENRQILLLTAEKR